MMLCWPHLLLRFAQGFVKGETCYDAETVRYRPVHDTAFLCRSLITDGSRGGSTDKLSRVPWRSCSGEGRSSGGRDGMSHMPHGDRRVGRTAQKDEQHSQGSVRGAA